MKYRLLSIGYRQFKGQKSRNSDVGGGRAARQMEDGGNLAPVQAQLCGLQDGSVRKDPPRMLGNKHGS